MLASTILLNLSYEQQLEYIKTKKHLLNPDEIECLDANRKLKEGRNFHSGSVGIQTLIQCFSHQRWIEDRQRKRFAWEKWYVPNLDQLVEYHSTFFKNSEVTKMLARALNHFCMPEDRFFASVKGDDAAWIGNFMKREKRFKKGDPVIIDFRTVQRYFGDILWRNEFTRDLSEAILSRRYLIFHVIEPVMRGNASAPTRHNPYYRWKVVHFHPFITTELPGREMKKLRWTKVMRNAVDKANERRRERERRIDDN